MVGYGFVEKGGVGWGGVGCGHRRVGVGGGGETYTSGNFHVLFYFTLSFCCYFVVCILGGMVLKCSLILP